MHHCLKMYVYSSILTDYYFMDSGIRMSQLATSVHFYDLFFQFLGFPWHYSSLRGVTDDADGTLANRSCIISPFVSYISKDSGDCSVVEARMSRHFRQDLGRIVHLPSNLPPPLHPM